MHGWKSAKEKAEKSPLMFPRSWPLWVLSCFQCERSRQTLLCHRLVRLNTEPEAAQSGRMYFWKVFRQPPLLFVMISHIQYWHPTPSCHLSAWNRHSYGSGFLYNPVKCRNSSATVGLPCSSNNYMPNTTNAYVRFFLCNSHSVETTVPPSSLQLTGTRLGSFITFVSRC